VVELAEHRGQPPRGVGLDHDAAGVGLVHRPADAAAEPAAPHLLEASAEVDDLGEVLGADVPSGSMRQLGSEWGWRRMLRLRAGSARRCS
jgi:hypothetical protein